MKMEVSELSRRASSRIGAYYLPDKSIEAYKQVIQESDDRYLGYDISRLDKSLYSTGQGLKKYKNQLKRDPENVTAVEPHLLAFGARESLAYFASRFHSTFGVASVVFEQLKKRIPDFQPSSILDFGTGPGTAIWASKYAWPCIKSALAVDISENMLDLLGKFRQKVPEMQSPSLELSIRRFLPSHSIENKSDLVISAFSLEDLQSEAMRLRTLEHLWASTKDILVLIDRGNPEGFKRIAESRQFLIDLENGKLQKKIQKQLLFNHPTTQLHIVAPCQHQLKCPLIEHNQWCSAAQRVHRDIYSMRIRKSKVNYEDISYSYCVLRRGQRPQKLENEWKRLILPPIKKKGHVIMDSCSPTGDWERFVVSKKEGKQVFHDARKSFVNDLWPHTHSGTIIKRDPVEDTSIKTDE